MFSKLWNSIRGKFGTIAVISLMVALSLTAYRCGRQSRDGEVADILTKLASSEKTVEVQKNLYAVKTHEIADLQGVIKNLRDDLELSGDSYAETIRSLLEQIEKAKQRILNLEVLVVQWKKAYEGAVDASQTEVPTEPGVPPRIRVDFRKDFGAIGVMGHTLTSPPEGFVRVEQLRPWKLTIAVVKNKDGTWSTYVASSDENLAVDIALSGIDPAALKPRWYQRLWLEGGVNPFGDVSASLGLSYRQDRWSLGLSCSFNDSIGCGPTFGYRLFK